MKQMNVVKIISKNIHNIRLKKNMSLQELAEKSGLEVETIKQLGHGTCHNLNLTTYAKIANGLGVNLDEITKGIIFVDD